MLDHRNGFDEIFGRDGYNSVSRFIFSRSDVFVKHGFYHFAVVDFVRNLFIRKSARFPSVFAHKSVTESVNGENFRAEISAVKQNVVAEFLGGFNRKRKTEYFVRFDAELLGFHDFLRHGIRFARPRSCEQKNVFIEFVHGFRLHFR